MGQPPRVLVLPFILLAASTAGATDVPGADQVTDQDRVRYEFAVRAVAGHFDGMGVRSDSGGVAIVEVDLKPKLVLGNWSLEFPLRLDHRQTFGADLSESVVGGEIDGWWRRGGMRVGPVAGVTWTRRADWPDLYQPNCGPSGTALCPTDRYTHLDAYAGWQHWYRLGEKRNLRWKVRWIQQSYVHDPNFDDADPTPTHVVPRDNHQLRWDSSYRAIRERVTYGVKLDGYYRWDEVYTARAANTGVTTTDLLRTWYLEPAAFAALRLGPAELSAEYSWQKQVDAVTGYYSWTAHHPSAKLEVVLTKRLSVAGRVAGWFVTYGPDSRDATEDGRTLESTKVAVKGGGRFEVAKGFAIVADAEWTKRDTNYPDYPPPGVAIDWDYVNFAATAGVEWKP